MEISASTPRIKGKVKFIYFFSAIELLKIFQITNISLSTIICTYGTEPF